MQSWSRTVVRIRGNILSHSGGAGMIDGAENEEALKRWEELEAVRQQVWRRRTVCTAGCALYEESTEPRGEVGDQVGYEVMVRCACPEFEPERCPGVEGQG